MKVLTFFDETYRAQGQTMLKSLFRHASGPLKAVVLWIGDKPALPEAPNIEVITVQQIMNHRIAGLFEARENRTYQEWCWSLETVLAYLAILGAIEGGEGGEEILYVDADSYFFANPMPLFRSLPENACVGLTPHWFPKGQEEREKKVGRFNYGTAWYRACHDSLTVAEDWMLRTLQKCDGMRAGHQTILDEWPWRLKDRFVELPRSLNCAPWQMIQWDIGTGESSPLGTPFHTGWERINGKGVHVREQIDMISYHYHEMRRGSGPNPVMLNGEQWNRTFYPLDESTIESVYRPYEMELERFL